MFWSKGPNGCYFRWIWWGIGGGCWDGRMSGRSSRVEKGSFGEDRNLCREDHSHRYLGHVSLKSRRHPKAFFRPSQTGSRLANTTRLRNPLEDHLQVQKCLRVGRVSRSRLVLMMGRSSNQRRYCDMRACHMSHLTSHTPTTAHFCISSTILYQRGTP